MNDRLPRGAPPLRLSNADQRRAFAGGVYDLDEMRGQGNEMHWTITHGDILTIPADVLVCSANVFLNLSGGVGGAILLRYGPAMQEELHRQLAQRQRRFVDRGEVVQAPPCGTPYKAVLHAVAVDGFYESSPQVVRSVVTKSLMMAAALGAKRVALTALATGYGKLTLRQFAESIGPLMSLEFPPIHEVIVCVRNPADQAELAATLGYRV